MIALPAWYQRMNSRERVLVLAVGGILFLFVNIFLWSWLFGAVGSSRDQLAARKATRAEQAVYIRERGLWEKRAAWLQEHQPVFKSASDASTLLDQLKDIAGKYNVLIENPAIGSGETTPYHQTVFASIETKSGWEPLVHFLYDVQQPESFIVFVHVNLAIDNNDPTTMRGKLKIARWLAPASRRKG
jgi:hypothetical protein